MPDVPLAPLQRCLPEAGKGVDGDELLDAFMLYTEEIGLTLYPAQEEAILEIFAGHNVVLNTPTGSGKSLVALAVCFKALAEARVAFYTAPIKALVTEKFFELCKVLGAEHVGMMTGDATVNPSAPIVCCTAEILANRALREGEQAQVDWVVMDEFHYYADRDRGSAWQIPLLTLPQARFLLMSATLGDTRFFIEELERRTGARSILVKSSERPVPLDFRYSEKPLLETIADEVGAQRFPIYIVHFSQRAASEQAQDLMSSNFLSAEAKLRIKEELGGFRFDSPSGKELSRFIRHGVGVHHAGMLPKYRRLVERLAQQGLLCVICGTDTLGVGVNVPIRTVLFTQLCKFDGGGTTILSVRDFHQVAGRAGRRGFDTRGAVIVQAPEHEIQNRMLKDKVSDNPKKLRKLRLKKPPERGYVAWNRETFERLRDSEPEPLVSSFGVTHSMLLNVLAGPNGCRRAYGIVRGCHEPESRKHSLMREGAELFRSLVSSNILTLDGRELRINADLQQDFSLHQALALYALETFEALDQEAPDYALVLLSIVESTIETPHAVIYKQLDTLKARKLAELKAAGVEYEERIEALEKMEPPKPEAEFIYTTFNVFRAHHPWVLGYNIQPKSIARDMHEQAASFNVYVQEYGLSRAEGVLLRYLSSVYRALRQTVPERFKLEAVRDLEEWLGAEIRRVDASLLEEWEQLSHPEQSLPESAAEAPPQDITTNRRAFEILLKNACWRVVQALAMRDYERALAALCQLNPPDAPLARDAAGDTWTSARLEQALVAYWHEYDAILTDAGARSGSRVQLETSEAYWSLRQVLSDPEEHHEWALLFEVDMAATREANRPVLSLVSVGGENS